jgi:hypothetical protein
MYIIIMIIINEMLNISLLWKKNHLLYLAFWTFKKNRSIEIKLAYKLLIKNMNCPIKEQNACLLIFPKYSLEKKPTQKR